MSSVQERRQARTGMSRRPPPRGATSRSDTGSRRQPNNRANWERQRSAYLDRARTATLSGDRIAAENYYQHAEHYYRMLNDAAD